ncbi:3-hydroxybutyryl-CoA dehydrogenase [Halomonas sp. MCCC 1A11036]|uniref:L-gulonate 3-dehydrogenase n=1 Tax=Billgrantia zhangzhouensis TaxID=2733481 RepID=A0ABS9AK30_9GAMM|nr:3-hydroxybutyryl-CoA dehydrogenase [Halomonas zhangzhouensis]MCE8022079.1 3-hydroxybutyryl-CoA dehydrogenase [Halomonas zhangzhouensis]
MNERIAVLGSGRMGEGIALSYMLAGHEVVMIDFKRRDVDERDSYYVAIRERLREELRYLEERAVVPEGAGEAILVRLSLVEHEAEDGSDDGNWSDIALAFEALPEVKGVKRDGFAWASRHFADDLVIASTTSTFLVTELAGMVSHPGRFMNAHWLNPAHLMPLVEVSKGLNTTQEAIDTLFESLGAIGKVPVLCGASPGYIVPRLQVLIMNEAARMVEEGVASADDIDTAIRIGFGLRYSVLGVLEFIDWGGGDTLYYASNYLVDALDERFRAPEVIHTNMREERRGFRDGRGFFDYTGVDLMARRRHRSDEFLERLRLSDLLPIVAISDD